MIPLTPVQILCGGWGFLPSPAAVFATPHRLHPGATATAVQWPTGVMEYGLAGAWQHRTLQVGAGFRYLGFSTPTIPTPEDALSPATGTFHTWSVTLAAEAFHLAGVQVTRREETLTGVYRTSIWDFQGSLTPEGTLPTLPLHVTGLLQARAVPFGLRGGLRISFAGRGLVQFTAGTSRWPHQGACAAILTPAGWIGAGGEHYPGWGSLWGVGGGLRLEAFQISWAYVFHPYGQPLIGAALHWIPPPQPEEEHP